MACGCKQNQQQQPTNVGEMRVVRFSSIKPGECVGAGCPQKEEAKEGEPKKELPRRLVKFM